MNVLVIKFLLVVLVVVGRAKAATRHKCDVVQALKDNNVPLGKEYIQCLCLVDSESSFRDHIVSKVNENDSRDYGIFQINSKYWCGNGTIAGGGCGMKCSDLLNSDIDDDTKCALKINSTKQGFYNWNGWEAKCEGKILTGIDNYKYKSC